MLNCNYSSVKKRRALLTTLLSQIHNSVRDGILEDWPRTRGQNSMVLALASSWSSLGLGLELVQSWPWPRVGPVLALASSWSSLGLGLELVLSWPWPRVGPVLASNTLSSNPLTDCKVSLCSGLSRLTRCMCERLLVLHYLFSIFIQFKTIFKSFSVSLLYAVYYFSLVNE